MIKKRSVLIVIFIGLTTTLLLGYFYLEQKKFTSEYREFLFHLQKIDHLEQELKTKVLNNAIYVYNNQDTMAKTINLLEKLIPYSEHEKILQRGNYKILINERESIQKALNQSIENTIKYLMLNAGIKNSLLYLSKHVEEAKNLPTKDKLLYIEANSIIKHFTNTKTMQDLDYIKDMNYLLSSESTSKQTQDFIHKFNLHSQYLIKKYPPYLHIIHEILNNDIENKINLLRNHFIDIAVNDFQSFDNFAWVLFTLFFISFIIIIFIFIKYIKSHNSVIVASNQLKHSLSHDRLTNFYNRNAFSEDILEINNPYIILININAFKHINDIYGNDIGDALLQKLANFLENTLIHTPNKRLYRLGGDDFAIVLENTQRLHVLQLAEAITEQIEDHTFIIETIKFNITVKTAINDIYPILENADLALKEIKKDNTTSVVEYSQKLDLKKKIEKNLETITLIKNAIKNDKILPYFQPIINLQTLQIEKYEALVRLIDKDGNVLTPYYFLDIASKTEYYQDITRIMAQKTMEVARKYPNMRFSINISMQDLTNEYIDDVLFNVLDSDLETASRIDIELLESEHLTDIKIVQNFIRRVHSYGSQVLIDDFGSGYSNFSYLSSLDINIIKIDGSIVKEITTDTKKLHILKSIHKFTSGMQMQNVAEFVETEEEALLLRENGIEYAQGYYFSKPLPTPLQEIEFSLSS